MRLGDKSELEEVGPMATAHARLSDVRPVPDTVHLEHRVRMEHKRVNRGLLAEPERVALRWLAERTPLWIKPDHLTALGVAGAFLAMVGFVCANWSGWFVGAVVLGLLLNWYGDSLDGTLARYRQIERPMYGYFMDHSCDLISQTLIFLGLGLSPFFTLTSALMALSMYLLMSAYTYLKVMILRTHQLSFGGMGATELRVAIAAWSLLAVGGLDLVGARPAGMIVLDQVIGALWSLVFIGFVWIVRSDVAKFRHQFDEHDRSAGNVAKISGRIVRAAFPAPDR